VNISLPILLSIIQYSEFIELKLILSFVQRQCQIVTVVVIREKYLNVIRY